MKRDNVALSAPRAHEAGFAHEAPSGTKKLALRFVAATPPLHTSHRLVLHIREANASFSRL